MQKRNDECQIQNSGFLMGRRKGKGEEEEEDSHNVFYVLISEITHYHFHRVGGQIQSTLKGTGMKLHLLKEGVSKNS